MARYAVRAIKASEADSPDMRAVIAGFASGASPAARQAAIQNLMKLHAVDLKTTKSLRYDATLTSRDGRNLKGDIRIGPGAFTQDYHWLAGVVFHEVVHSDQFAFYADNGVAFANEEAKSDTERVMVALDECEGFFWPWYNSQSLGLSTSQQSALRREVQLWLIEIDEKATVELARKGQFEQARLALIKRWTAENGRKP
jgi:hypothetical protein